LTAGKLDRWETATTAPMVEERHYVLMLITYMAGLAVPGSVALGRCRHKGGKKMESLIVWVEKRMQDVAKEIVRLKENNFKLNISLLKEYIWLYERFTQLQDDREVI